MSLTEPAPHSQDKIVNLEKKTVKNADAKVSIEGNKTLTKVKASKERESQFEEFTNPLIKLPFHVLGFNSQKQILIWYKGKILATPVSQLKPDDLKLLVGNIQEEGQGDIYKIIKNQIITLANNKGLVDDDEPVKSGIWKFNNDWVIVSGKQAAIIRNDEFSFLETPIINDRTIEFERNSWINLNILRENFKQIDIKKSFLKVRQLVSQWCWQDTSVVDFVTAFIMLQAFQYVMRWRPWIYLLGAAGTGKSSFLEHVLEKIFRDLIKRLDKSTAHATAQSIGGSGKIGIFDEFEKNRHLSDVLELLKLCNRGGRKTSGTASEKANEYSLHHMPWLASIYLPLTFRSDQAQLSRVIKFDLKKVPEGKSIVGLSEEEAEALLCEIISAVISTWSLIEEKTKEIEANKKKYIDQCSGKIDGRCVENFMYALALLSQVYEEEPKIPKWAINEIKDDGVNILETIIMSKIRYKFEEFLIIDLINKSLGEPLSININESEAKEILRKNGLSVVRKRPIGWSLAVRCEEVSESILKFHGVYKGMDIKSPLERLEGVEKNVKTDWGNQNKLWAMQIPGEHINNLSGAFDK